MSRNNPKGWKNGIFVPFFLCLHFVLSSLLCEMGVSVVQMSISFGVESWFVDGCFIADLSMVVSLLICRWLFHCWWIFLCKWMFFWGGFGRMEEWFDWVRGWLGIGRRCSYARVYTRSRTRSFVFLLSQVSQRMGLKMLHHPKNDVSFYRKWRVVLLKTTCRFTENNVLFCGKWRVVLDWRSKSCFEDGVLGSFWGGVAAWKCDIFWMLFLLSV